MADNKEQMPIDRVVNLTVPVRVQADNETCFAHAVLSARETLYTIAGGGALVGPHGGSYLYESHFPLPYQEAKPL